MRCKIAVWQEANKSVRQTQRPFNMELELIWFLHDEQFMQFIVNL